jgi:hypothetical protein
MDTLYLSKEPLVHSQARDMIAPLQCAETELSMYIRSVTSRSYPVCLAFENDINADSEPVSFQLPNSNIDHLRRNMKRNRMVITS